MLLMRTYHTNSVVGPEAYYEYMHGGLLGASVGTVSHISQSKKLEQTKGKLKTLVRIPVRDN